MTARSLAHMLHAALSDLEAFHVECIWATPTESDLWPPCSGAKCSHVCVLLVRVNW